MSPCAPSLKHLLPLSSHLAQKDLNVQPNQVLALFNKIVRKYVKIFSQLEEAEVEKSLPPISSEAAKKMKPTAVSLEEDLEQIDEATKHELKAKQDALLKGLALPEYAIKGTEADWKAEEALASTRSKVPSLVSIKRKLNDGEDGERPQKKQKKEHGEKKKKFHKGKKD